MKEVFVAVGYSSSVDGCRMYESNFRRTKDGAMIDCEIFLSDPDIESVSIESRFVRKEEKIY